MAKTATDVEKKIGLLEETEEVQKGRGWMLWVISPLVLAALAGVAFLVVRRRISNSEQ